MKTIVAPTDFSAISINAVNYAAGLACAIAADLSLIHVCAIPLSFSEVPAPLYTVEEMVADAKEQIKALKSKIIYRTGDRIKINTEVRQGNVVAEIYEYCSSINNHIHAVVMGAENASTLERFLIGGKTLSAIQQLSWPLIVVPSDAKFTSLRKIGLACDFKEVVETIPVKEIKSLVKEFNAELHVLHISTEGEVSRTLETVEESKWLKNMLKKLNPKYHFINNPDIEKSITEFAEKHNIDLLIIIPKKHNLISKIFQHSHSKRMVLHAHVPVMAIHE